MTDVTTSFTSDGIYTVHAGSVVISALTREQAEALMALLTHAETARAA
jgi:hypothetical protein